MHLSRSAVSPVSLFTLSIFCATLLNSCSMALPYCVDDALASVRNDHMAKSAWYQRRGIYKKTEDCLSDFKAGFKDGYVAAIEGKAECPPTLAPPAYWGVLYQSETGRCCVNAWHNGWAHGAIAADQDGLTNISQIVIRCPCGTCHAGGACPHGHSGHSHEPIEHIIVEPPVHDQAPSQAPPMPVPVVEEMQPLAGDSSIPRPTRLPTSATPDSSAKVDDVPLYVPEIVVPEIVSEPSVPEFRLDL